MFVSRCLGRGPCIEALLGTSVARPSPGPWRGHSCHRSPASPRDVLPVGAVPPAPPVGSSGPPTHLSASQTAGSPVQGACSRLRDEGVTVPRVPGTALQPGGLGVQARLPVCWLHDLEPFSYPSLCLCFPICRMGVLKVPLSKVVIKIVVITGLKGLESLWALSRDDCMSGAPSGLAP